MPLPARPRRRTRHERRIKELEKAREEVYEKLRYLWRGDPNKAYLEQLADAMTEAIKVEQRDWDNRRFVKVTKRANKALDDGR